ncbi:hypothetical protein M5X00_14795 [Paenibacillus alvei]|nr:hypothetical protein [Paenibacillus alvei]MCY9543370.1 hypothetical protein [Paenibacillus alvei]MCY9704750.1 hypothetical protein [Paenibacillus alvei]MCY9733697.1 hypothetical protein [Paenibacillus alvei]MCY9755512.1 hypothetical protein [Paenibacillus alvei]MEC0082063.1 hypothetical protein [Paenibacillus alvei]
MEEQIEMVIKDGVLIIEGGEDEEYGRLDSQVQEDDQKVNAGERVSA